MKILCFFLVLFSFCAQADEMVRAENGKTLGYRIKADDPIIGIWDGIAVSHHAGLGHQQGVLRVHIHRTGKWCARGYYRQNAGIMLYRSEQFCGELFMIAPAKYRVVYFGHYGEDLVLAFLSSSKNRLETVALAGPGMEDMIESDRFFRVEKEQKNNDMMEKILKEWIDE